MSDRDEFEAWLESATKTRRLIANVDPGSVAYELAREAWQAARRWRPIEEAPKDGTLILLCSNGGAVWVGFWRPDDEHPYGKAGWTRFNCDDVGWEPNNWMPLPEPPNDHD